MWDDARDAKLVKLKSQGYSFAEIAAAMGVTRNAALGRYQRILGREFPSDVRRKAEHEATLKAKRAAEARHRAALVASVKAGISTGKQRKAVILKARQEGATLELIGSVLGLTRQRIHQLVN